MIGLLPGWSHAPLADIAKWGSGGTPQAGNPEYYGGGIPWAVIGDLNDGVVTQTRATITEAGLSSSSAKMIPKGAVLVAMYGSIGKLGIAGREISSNQAIAFAVPGPHVLPRYLFYYLLSQRHALDAAGKGAAQRNISQTVLKAWPIHFPRDLTEQLKIVETLDDHLSRLDAADSYMKSVAANGRSLVLAAMANAVDGSLTVGSGEALEVLPFGSAVLKVPPTWKRSSVGQVATLIDYGTSAKASAECGDGCVPVLRMGNIKASRLDWTNLKYLPSSHSDISRLLLQKGDLLFNRTNSAELVGKSAVFDSDQRTTFASYLIRVRFTDTVDPRWVNTVVNSPWGRAYISSVVSQQVGQANVNGTKLKAFPLPIPPLEEQIERMEQLTAYIDYSDRLTDEAGRLIIRSASLRRALLDAAFSGRLTGRVSDLDRVEEIVGV